MTHKVVLLLWPTLIKRSRNGQRREKDSGNSVHPNELYIITWFLITVEPLPRPPETNCNSAIHQAPVVQKVDSTIHRINHHPVDSAIDFPKTYQRDGDLSNG